MADALATVFVAVFSLLIGGGVVYAYYGWYAQRRDGDDDPLPFYYATVLNYTFGSYYYFDVANGEQYFAPKLLRILDLDDFVTDFSRFETVFDETSFLALKNAMNDLQEGKNAIQVQLKTLTTQRYFECFANAERTQEDELKSIILWFRDVTANRSRQQRITKENEKLKSELSLLSTTINALSFPVWRRDQYLSIKYCNLAYSEIAEETPEKVIDSEELELHKHARNLARVAQESGEQKSERRHVIVHGERRLFALTEAPANETTIIGSAQDITELERMQEEVQRHISAQSDLLESSTSAMAIYGPDMRLKSYNFAFVKLWGLDEAWLSSEPTYSEILEMLREKRKLPEQANFPAFKQHQIRLFTELIDLEEEFFYLPDGKSLRVIAIPHALGGILFAYEDVTDRLALERSYNTLIAVQKETLDKLHEGVAVFAEDGRLKLSNPIYRKLWKLPENIVEDEPHFYTIVEQIKDFFDADDWERFKMQHLNQAQMRTVHYERLERTDGSVIDWTSVPLPDGATLFTFFDVTDSTLVERSLRERNDALQEADRLKTEFLANVSYELRSPLTSISGFSEMLRQDYFGPLTGKQREYVDGIHQSSLQLMHLIDDILDLATIEAGYMQLSVSRFDIYGMLSAIISLVRERAKESDILLNFACDSRIGIMLGDETRLKQAVFNLVNNAMKYTPAKGAVTLAAEETAEGEVVIWVSDNGIGIAPEEQAAVFSKFYRGGATGNSRNANTRTGTGLGLPMVKSFIELHGGRVELTSTPGVGTRVACYLPRHNMRLEHYLQEVAS